MREKVVASRRTETEGAKWHAVEDLNAEVWVQACRPSLELPRRGAKDARDVRAVDRCMVAGCRARWPNG